MAFGFDFKQAIKFNRAQMKPGNRKRTYKSIKPNWNYPAAIESTYRKQLNKTFKQLTKPTMNYLLNNLERWIEEANILKTDNSIKNVNRTDDWMDELQEMLNNLGGVSTDIFGDGTNPDNSLFYGILIAIGADMLLFGDKQWEKQSKKYAGVKWETDQSWWNEVRKRWERENYTLMKNVSQDYISKMNEVVFRGVRQGKTAAQIRNELRQLDKKMTNTRINTIARDQIGKLNSQIAQQQNINAGIETYIWRTAMDERVRGRPTGLYPKAIPSHWEMESKIGRWDNASLYAENEDVAPKTGKVTKWKNKTEKMPIAHPGEPINCRCTAIPRLDDILFQIDNELEQE